MMLIRTAETGHHCAEMAVAVGQRCAAAKRVITGIGRDEGEEEQERYDKQCKRFLHVQPSECYAPEKVKVNMFFEKHSAFPHP